MKLIYEDSLIEKLPASAFYEALLEFLQKDDKIKDSDDYVREYMHEFDPAKKNSVYLDSYPIKDIKADLAQFIHEWVSCVNEIPGVFKINDVRVSKYYGFSNYIDISFDRPKDRRLMSFYNENPRKYNKVSFRFSEHPSHNDDNDLGDGVLLVGKSFNDAAKEMYMRIENYIVNLRMQEKHWLEKQQKKNNKKRR